MMYRNLQEKDKLYASSVMEKSRSLHEEDRRKKIHANQGARHHKKLGSSPLV